MPLVPFTKDGKTIQGTLEVLSGAADVWVADGDDPTDHTKWNYSGTTKVYWDGQYTERRDGQVVFIDQNGDEVLESEIVWKEEE